RDILSGRFRAFRKGRRGNRDHRFRERVLGNEGRVLRRRLRGGRGWNDRHDPGGRGLWPRRIRVGSLALHEPGMEGKAEDRQGQGQDERRPPGGPPWMRPAALQPAETGPAGRVF
ncbi:hypothetical protein RZS08_39530, partial [Arthrospira platensis SPKY1]|nr:hypothetical protein [Arthrospira platensis SPKY1]